MDYCTQEMHARPWPSSEPLIGAPSPSPTSGAGPPSAPMAKGQEDARSKKQWQPHQQTMRFKVRTLITIVAVTKSELLGRCRRQPVGISTLLARSYCRFLFFILISQGISQPGHLKGQRTANQIYTCPFDSDLDLSRF